jgi:hypothetical protein
MPKKSQRDAREKRRRGNVIQLVGLLVVIAAYKIPDQRSTAVVIALVGWAIVVTGQLIFMKDNPEPVSSDDRQMAASFFGALLCWSLVPLVSEPLATILFGVGIAGLAITVLYLVKAARRNRA